jgi:putative peptidoglycan lipid II flippase
MVQVVARRLLPSSGRLTRTVLPKTAGQRVSSGIARGAALIAALTVLSRMMGLVRTLVFSQSVGAGCLGTAYVTAYQVPNLIYELILGGALTSAMVPVLARSAEKADIDAAERRRVSQITSALVTWSVVLLVPLTIGVAAAARPIAELLNPANPNAHCVRAQMVSTTSGILVVFAPQIVLYGLSVVLFGLLQAYRRFGAYALAPLVANFVLIGSYLIFIPLDNGQPLGSTPLPAVLTLSVGATLGVAVLVLVAVLPTRRLGLLFRPTLRLPPGVARKAGGLAAVGAAELVIIDVQSVVVIALANGRGDTGALVIYNYASLAYNAVCAVLAMSIVTSTFPVLSAREGDEFDRTCAGSTRAVMLAAWLGAAVLAAVAVPAAHVLAKEPGQVAELAGGFILFAPGVAGIAVVANLSRVMFALGRLKVALFGLVGSWLLVIAANLVLGSLAQPRQMVAALALGTAIGQTVVAIPLVIVTRGIRGPASVRGLGRATLAGLTAAVAGAAAGTGISLAVPLSGRVAAGGVAVLAAVCAVLIFGVVAYLLDRADLKTVFRRRLS